MAARFKGKYVTEIRPAIAKELNISNPMAIPRLEKIVINMGLGEATQNVKIMDPLVADLGAISGQKPVTTRAKKSIAALYQTLIWSTSDSGSPSAATMKSASESQSS